MAAPPRDSNRPPSASLADGSVVASRYRIDAYLAEGGMGQVYRAHDLELDVPLALKTIHPTIASDPAALRRFKQEVLLARSVTHVNVCRIFDLGRDETRGVSFLTMEFLPGRTLASRIGTHEVLPPGESLPLVRQMAGALDTAHRAGIVHRDFKSANVMLVPTGNGDRAVITDFGLAVTLDSTRQRDAAVTREAPAIRAAGPSSDATETMVAETICAPVPGARGMVGTPAYMSPEQVRGEEVGPASDLYALGVVLFEMCTGRLPFHEATPLDTARAHLDMEPPRPGAFAGVDACWERAILRLLAKSPSERFITAHDLVRALEGRVDETTATPCRLPAERDAFIGRTVEIDTIASHLDPRNPRTSRLVTVLGPGGTGKTRLVQKYAWDHLADWPGGIWFCDLSEARSADAILSAVATSLDVPLARGDAASQLVHAIAGRGRCLLILDNFEQLVPHAAETLGRWLEETTSAGFVVTSQERLQLPGEVVCALEPLDPTSRGVELFEVRARAHRAGFTVDDSNRALVEAITRRLDGLPLAIELAASRLRILSLEQLAVRLADRFALLAGGKKGRHATLRATLDWSWDLLTAWEQSAMAQVSVFEGGFTLEAAEAVIDLSSCEDAPLALDVIQSLVDKSWLRAAVVRGAPRFSAYVMVQEYAAEKLGGAGSTQTSEVEARHARYFAEMGTEAAIASLQRHGGTERWAAAHVELENIVAACRRAMGRGDEATTVSAYTAAVSVFELRGPASAALRLGEEVTATLHTTAALARGLQCLASSERLAGKIEAAQEHYERVLEIHREDGHRGSQASVLGNLGVVSFERGRMDEAREHLDAALTLHREVGNRPDEGLVLGILGSLHQHQGRMDLARECHQGALAIQREIGNRRVEGMVLGNLGTLCESQGRMLEARAHYEAALAIHRELGNRRFEGLQLGNLGVLEHNQDQWDEAWGHYEQALIIHREVGDRTLEGNVLANLAELHAGRGRVGEARETAERALAIHREVRNRRGEAIVLRTLGEILGGEDRCEEARGHLQEGIAVFREMEDYLEVGRSLCALGELEAGRDLKAALAALAEAESIAANLAVGPESDLGRKIERLRART